jgi:sulfatase maturation enzyme AslB (radical SAM superfamily)
MLFVAAAEAAENLMNDTTYCIISHVGIFNQNPYQQIYPCCAFEPDKSNFDGNKHITGINNWLSSDYYNYITNSLDNGVKLAECSDCWTKEVYNMKSIRQNSNATLVPKNWLNAYKKSPQPLVLFADISVDNICNYACIMCNPASSSKIYNRWISDSTAEHIIEILNNNTEFLENSRRNTVSGNYELLDQVLEYKPRTLNITGGEPLLNNRIIKKLQDYAHKDKTNLSFVTNGSVNILEVSKKLQGYKNINFVVSLDAWGDANDYIRLHSDWETIIANICEAKSHNISIQIQTVIQSIGLESLFLLVKWVKEMNFEHDFSYLYSPWQLSCDLLPPDYINNCLDNIKDDTIVSFIKKNYQYKSNNLNKLSAFIQWHERNTNLKLANINPSLENILTYQ